MSRIDEHKAHLKSLQEQFHKQYAIGNYKKCNDLKKGIKRVRKEIKEYERLKSSGTGERTAGEG